MGIEKGRDMAMFLGCVQMGMWALWSAPMIMSTELRNGSIAPAMKAILLNKGALAISDDPLGRQATSLGRHCHSTPSSTVLACRTIGSAQ